MRTAPQILQEAKDFGEKHRDDIAIVIKGIERDETGIDYWVNVSLRSLAAPAFEKGEDEQGYWTKRVDFGQTDYTCAGGMAFVDASIEQEEIADAIAIGVWGHP